ncbi:IS1182 family transposase [Clostridium felsineum]|uniref:IS1182 family transposase n=1 Tax=Clostridium felsineum TaxID=36839 RepID=UPI00203384AF|nr:IS1182 family transposase [Clostridium felsineum]URZ16703.1 IS1182 family transposase ISBpu1 [Clostridium felsineum DSM 794]
MLTKRGKELRSQIELNSLEDLVPKDHLLRKIDKSIDFNFIYDEVSELYSDFGRPSIDPVVLIKIVLVQYLFGIPSMRQTIREIQVNIAYRWFLGYSMSEKIPHFSTFNKNYERRFKDTDVFTNIFVKILEIAEKEGFLALEQVYIDSTHIKASANKKKFKRVNVEIEAKKYKNKLDKEIDLDRQEHGKKPLKKTKKIETKEIVQSTTDKESGMFYKNEKEKCFAYLAHTACDDANFVLGFEVTAGNVHDSIGFYDVYNKVYSKFGDKLVAVAVDAGYKNPCIAKTILDSGILPSMPYKRPMTKEVFFKKYEYAYDEFYDCYICPNNKILKYSTTNRDGYKEYKSNNHDCESCAFIKKCTNSKNKQKLITRHIWENYLEEAEYLRHERYVNSVYKRRKETIERIFADAKEKHGMRFTHLRSLAKIKMAVTLTFACMNLKKLANRLWKRRRYLLVLYKIYFKIHIYSQYKLNGIFSFLKICHLSTV